ncbi:MAG: hypothetical protein JO149_06705, partial [Gammaproteobacteria bacterium]|nr:hypothetical protein [Gammaproteobacteria bacterium]
MPRIDDEITQTKHRAFKKKPYRPWNLLDDDSPNIIEKNIVEEPFHENVINKESNSNQLVINSISESNQNGNNQSLKVTNIESKSNPISNQISNHLLDSNSKKNTSISIERNVVEEIQRVTGLQRKILFYIVEDCILRGELSSNPITTELLQKLTNADIDTLKTATQRLINKNFMERGDGKRGKGGFAIFHITEKIRNAVIDAQKRNTAEHHLVTNWVSKKESINVYSSGSNKNTTTNETKTNSEFISSWECIDIQPLTHIGFTKSHLQQIILDDKLTSEIVQDSIYAFAFDLENNNKEKSLKSGPLNYFMGILRSGKPYAPPANYESPQDAAMRIYLERKKEIELKR